MASIVYGWLHGGTGQPLYVYQKQNTWGVTVKLEEATKFSSVQACNEHFLSKHSFPENYEHCTRDGFLKYLNIESKQLTLF